jgi:hypothetical protein
MAILLYAISEVDLQCEAIEKIADLQLSVFFAHH